MRNLIKYEFRKTWVTKLIILAIAVFAEAAFLITLYADKEEMNALTIGLLTLLAFGGVLMIGVQSIATMHQDMNTKQGYMLYMTPNSCYRILGSKVIENGLSLFAAGAFFFALGALDITLLFGHHGELNQLREFVDEMLKQMSMEIQLDGRLFAWFTVSFLCGWLCTVVAAYLADVVSTCLLNGKKFNGWVSLLLFILLMWAVGYVHQFLPGNLSIYARFAWGSAISVACAALMYAATAFLMDRHLSV